MITMSEIARLTGVSQPTVSRVLNGNASVNPEVAKKVLACAKEHNYQPNMIAKSLNGSNTHLLAAIVPDIANPFFADLIKIIEREAGKEGYSVLIFNSDYKAEKEQMYLGLLQQYRVDGLLVVPVHVTEEALKPFKQLMIPWIIMTNRAENADSVYISHRKSSHLVAEHMLEIQAEKFLFIGDKKDKKFIGFEEELRRKGIDTKSYLRVFWEQDRTKTLELMIEYIRETSGKIGIYAYNDMQAFVVMNALMRAGIAIPEKVALVGFDNTFIANSVVPGITSINQPLDKMGSFAVQRLIVQINQKKRLKMKHSEFAANLIIRASSKE
ncbi:MAG: LacI family DNA-binding transcriptional regulator [Lachnospiraceae bacterium]|nr:LacI family DNA-binding transcriptional regulator [Lachnospiraceae bacterium]